MLVAVCKHSALQQIGSSKMLGMTTGLILLTGRRTTDKNFAGIR